MIMITLLYSILFVEKALILSLLFRTPLRKLVIMGLDQLKSGKGPVVATTVAATIFVVFSAFLYSAMEIQRRTLEAGSVNPTDEVLMAERLLEASLMGFFLFLGMVIDRLHYYIKELTRVRKELGDEKIEVTRLRKELEDEKNKQGSDTINWRRPLKAH